MWCGVPYGVGETEAPGATLDCGRVECFEDLGARTSSVLSHIHDGQPLTHCVGDRFFGHLQEFVECPIFSVLSYRCGAEEGSGLDLESGLLCDPDDRLYICPECSGSAVRLDRESGGDDLWGKCADVSTCARTGAW